MFLAESTAYIEKVKVQDRPRFPPGCTQILRAFSNEQT